MLNCIFILQEEVHYGRQQHTDMLHKDRAEGGEKTQKATLVSFYLDASTSNAGFDKVTASKSSEKKPSVQFI